MSAPDTTAPAAPQLPAEMRAERRWLVWRYEHVTNQQTGEIRRTKVPYQAATPTRKASSTNAKTWGTYAQAVAAVEHGDADGVGFVLGGGWVGIDLDHCRDAETGELEPWAAEIIAQMASYTEESPSREGAHIILHAEMPGDGSGQRRGLLEIYGAGRYFTMTGKHLDGTPETVEDRQAQLDTLLAEHFAPKPGKQQHQGTTRVVPSAAADMPNGDLLAKALQDAKFAALWAGDTGAYGGDMSSATAALCMKLAFWTGRDAARMDALFRQSGLMRDKWDEKRGDSTWGAREIATAISLQTDVYTPRRAQEQQPPTRPKAPVSIARDDDDDDDLTLNTWPEPMAKAAYIGPIGDFVRKLAPQTEAAKEGLLMQALVAAGNAMGRHGYFVAEADHHHTNLFAVMVGGTGARKGVSWGHVRRFLGRADETWMTDHIVNGLSTGEGLINVVKDEEPAIADKVALAVESEFASVFKVKGREGNTLSTVLRQAWDGDTLRSLTKNTPLKATGAHISIVGHITPDELRRVMSETDASNGFGNRMLWVCVRRARYLPDGGEEVNVNSEVQKLRAAIEAAKTCNRLMRDAEATKLWHSRYKGLTSGRPGLLGAVTNRAEAQVIRLSLIYALLDQSADVKLKHLEAALAVWDYCLASARFIFGAALGDALAEKLDAELTMHGAEGMSRTDIYNFLGNNVPAKEIARALGLLASQSRAEMRSEKRASGRTANRWYSLTYDVNNVDNGTSSETKPDVAVALIPSNTLSTYYVEPQAGDWDDVAVKDGAA